MMRRVRLMSLLSLCLILSYVAWRSWSSVDVLRTSEQVCRAMAEKRYDDALAQSETLALNNPNALETVNCRCFSLLATEQADRCHALLSDVLVALPPGHGLPDKDLIAFWLQGARVRGQTTLATEVADQARQVYPDVKTFFDLAIELRSLREDLGDILEALQREYQQDSVQGQTHRVWLARVSLFDVKDAQNTLRILGNRPVGENDRHFGEWYALSMQAHAALGQAKQVFALADQWEARGGDAVMARTWQWFAISNNNLELTKVVQGLEQSMDNLETIYRKNPWLAWMVLHRIVGHLQEENTEKAIAHLRQAEPILAKKKEDKEHIKQLLYFLETQRDIAALESETTGLQEQAALHLLPPQNGAKGVYTLSPAGEDHVAESWRLQLGVDASARVIERRSGKTVIPTRWVYRDAQGQVIASGTVALQPGETQFIQPVLQEPVAPIHFARQSRQGDGLTRVFALVLDCADWRIVRYLTERGELPTTRWMMQNGFYAVLWSEPAFTSAAMRKLAWPTTNQGVTVLGLLHELGDELAGLSSIGKNPLDILSWVLPTKKSTLMALAEAGISGANMLFTHGNIDAGRHAQVYYPDNRQEAIRVERGRRHLTSEEKLLTDPSIHNTIEIQETAAAMDAAITLAKDNRIALPLLRVEALDLITHGTYAQAARTAQDDGKGALYSTYRYLDWRVGQLLNTMDEDDVIIVMSDHGIRTPFQHDPRAVFLMVGAGVRPGALHDPVPIETIPSLLAHFFGVQIAWPKGPLSAHVSPQTTWLSAKPTH